MTKILSFQYNSVYQHGGAGRVLRRLFQGREDQVVSLFIKTDVAKDRTGLIKEIAVPVFLLQRSWMRWRLRNFVIWLRDVFFLEATINNVRKIASTLDYDVIHTINHGPFSTTFCDRAFSSKPLWVSFHDHFSTCSTFEDTNKLWNLSERRLVISRELGAEYQRLFGKKEFEVITDGVAREEISNPKPIAAAPLTIYFAGLLHLEYINLFRTLADSADLLVAQGVAVKLVLRGTQKLEFLNNRSFDVDYRQDFVTDQEVKNELDAADILYLPIKFNVPAFYLYSLSTKMVSYLGAAGSILYHGPHDSAAYNLLKEFNAATGCVTLDASDLKDSILSIVKDGVLLSANAKGLAKSQFDLEKIQDRFWLDHSL
jgi:hypothetical protein